MPSFRGIDISIVPGPNLEGLPELPHPESSSVRLRSPHATSPMSTTASSFTLTPEKCRPTTSVYIPSSPGLSLVLLAFPAYHSGWSELT